MLESPIIDKIERFVYAKPRSMLEIAQHIGKNWRTADRYVESIEKEYGTIATRVFRGGSRGALKIAYWASAEKISSSVFQEKLEEKIMHGMDKQDFSPFDIFQYVDDKYKKAVIERAVKENSTDIFEFAKDIARTQKQLIIFSGNLSFVNLRNKKVDMFDILDQLVKRGVSIKIVSRVDIAGIGNIEKALSLNLKYGKELVEIRHRAQPMRAIISDRIFFRIKEIEEPTGKVKELDKKVFIFYTIRDREWVDWLAKIFWNMFSGSITADRRIQEIKKLGSLKL
jgi:hypothetical protein